MIIEPIVEGLKAERDKIDTALKILQSPVAAPAAVEQKGVKKRSMSTAARKKISEAMRARWDKIKKMPHKTRAARTTTRPAAAQIAA